jgi:DNA-directed RNA polymerase subunit N (RpoN/RPB10)
METYKEYVIRCKSCNEQLACYASEYEALLNGNYSVEDTLNILGIINPCSRIAMMNPTIVSFNMENREVIEGFRTVDSVDDADPIIENTGHPIFSNCMMINSPIQQHAIKQPSPAPIIQGVNIPTNIRTYPNVPMLNVIPKTNVSTLNIIPSSNLTNLQTIVLAHPPIRREPLVRPIKELIISPINIPPPLTEDITIIPDIKDVEELGIGVPVTGPLPENINIFREPTMVGLPTINPNPLIQQHLEYVGADKHIPILNGRTYLAQ